MLFLRCTSTVTVTVLPLSVLMDFCKSSTAFCAKSAEFVIPSNSLVTLANDNSSVFFKASCKLTTSPCALVSVILSASLSFVISPCVSSLVKLSCDINSARPSALIVTSTPSCAASPRSLRLCVRVSTLALASSRVTPSTSRRTFSKS